MEVNKTSAMAPLSFTNWPHGCQKNLSRQSSMALLLIDIRQIVFLDWFGLQFFDWIGLVLNTPNEYLM
jgi:hypothetical protein